MEHVRVHQDIFCPLQRVRYALQTAIVLVDQHPLRHVDLDPSQVKDLLLFHHAKAHRYMSISLSMEPAPP